MCGHKCYVTFCSSDVDECVAEAQTCGEHAVCVNTAGSYVCQCQDGFSLQGGHCQRKFNKACTSLPSHIIDRRDIEVLSLTFCTVTILLCPIHFDETMCASPLGEVSDQVSKPPQLVLKLCVLNEIDDNRWSGQM